MAAAGFVKLPGQFQIDLTQMGDVAQRIVELPLAERPARPVGEARALVQIGLGDPAHQGLVAGLVAIAADHRRDLGVEHRRRDQGGEIVEDFHILSRRVEHLDHVLVRHQFEQRRKIDAVGERIDDRGVLVSVAGLRDLDQAELRPVGALAHELGVDGDEGGLGIFGGQPGQGIGGGNHVHGASV